MNKALIAKVGWRLMHDDTSLWARVMRSKQVNILTDKWLGDSSLIEVVIADVPKFVGMKVCDLWIDGVRWDLRKIAPFVSEDTKLELAAVVVDKVTWVRDRLSWRDTPDGRFTVSSAYLECTNRILDISLIEYGESERLKESGFSFGWLGTKGL
ncbi:unnamed protein product [Microthlaspi erraticum]|uniref:Reverse transcriptase zinc-binding domain-containing protein n=1 Tax=Microthlaspi erraticum TaxID=1685480 RepID=A0A6D2LCM0_9BRAS|nr:unnamed protein product [Microthlaspi erraticum]